ncbi:MAG: hypothetical protein NVS4B8_08380 [Herpetosiphon sp.]
MAMLGKQRTTKQTSAGQGIGNLLLVLMVLIGGAYGLWPVVTTGDPLWWRSEFTGQATEIIVHDHGALQSNLPGSERFDTLNRGVDAALSQGIRAMAMGFSQVTWDEMLQHGVVVEVAYATPIRIHNRSPFFPTRRLMLLLSGEELHTTGVLFRQNSDGTWDTLPFGVNRIDLLAASIGAHDGTR